MAVEISIENLFELITNEYFFSFFFKISIFVIAYLGMMDLFRFDPG